MRRSLVLGFLCLCVMVGPAAAQRTYVNPVIPGDHPDPTLTRIGNDYYSSGSSFNITPKIYHSTDLVHWRVISQPVSADWSLFGDSPGGGVWGGHMVLYNDIYWHFFGRGTGGREMYYVTSNSPSGPWSNPVRMQPPPGIFDLGVDNSIFIDDDNRWFLLTKAGHENNFIVELNELGQPSGHFYDLRWLNPNSQGNPYGWAEGPVMWKHDGYYYYSFAEHLQGAQYVMRSAVLSDDPNDWDTPRVLFERVSDPSQRIFRAANHNSPAVTAADGTSWTISHSYNLSGSNEEWKALGRQGLLNEIRYVDGWPVAVFPSNSAVAGPDLPSSGIPWAVPRSDMFTSARLAPDWSFLGYTPRQAHSTTERPGWLRLRPHAGRTSIVQNAAEHAFTLITRVDFSPNAAADEAGLWTLNGPETLRAKLYVTTGSGGGRSVVFSFDQTAFTESVPGNAPVWLRMQRDGHMVNGAFSTDGTQWTPVGSAINTIRMNRHQPASEAGYDFNAFTGNQQGLFVLGNTQADFNLYVYRDAYSTIPARYPANFSGVVPSTGYLGGIQDGRWAMYPGVEFGRGADIGDGNYHGIPRSLAVVASSAGPGGTIVVSVDSLDGQRIAEVHIGATDGWFDYQTFSAEVEQVTGQRDVFFMFEGSAGEQLFRIERFSFSPLAVPTSTVEQPGEARTVLGGNHPNPFTGTTSIAYELGQAGHVTLEVYDLLGRKVATLVNETKSAGSHVASFDGTGLTGGVYFYRLSGRDHQAVKMMTLIR